MRAITKKIVDFKVKAGETKPAPLPDDDPGVKRIDGRPEGELSAVSKKITYYTSEGKKKIYLLISFMQVEGVLDGEKITIERPIEFFFPIGQGTSEHQWISATMRSLSLAARGGYVAQNLQDMAKVAWDKGPVRYGVNRWGKPVQHNSEVAAIAYAIQETLRDRGFLDADGNQVPSRVLSRQSAEIEPDPAPPESDMDDAGETAEPSVPLGTIGTCSSCGEPTRLMDGCECCTGCGLSKC